MGAGAQPGGSLAAALGRALLAAVTAVWEKPRTSIVVSVPSITRRETRCRRSSSYCEMVCIDLLETKYESVLMNLLCVSHSMQTSSFSSLKLQKVAPGCHWESCCSYESELMSPCICRCSAGSLSSLPVGGLLLDRSRRVLHPLLVACPWPPL